MPEVYRVTYTLRAADELRDIVAYIERDSPQNARTLITRILEAIESLELFPERYPLIRNTLALGQDVRSMPVNPYLVRYHIDEQARRVTILSVRHGARKPEE